MRLANDDLAAAGLGPHLASNDQIARRGGNE